MMFIKFNRPANLRLLPFISLIGFCLSVLIVYFRVEPSPADYIAAISIVLAAIDYLLQRTFKPFKLLDLLLVGYLAIVAAQLIFVHNSTQSRFGLITLYLGLSYFAITYVLSVCKHISLVWLWRAYVVGSLITSGWLAGQLVWVYSLGGDWNRLYFGRPDGGFKDANVAGPFLLPAIFYCLWWFYVQKQWRYLIGAILLSVGLLATFSRGAYLGYGAGLGLLSIIWIWASWTAVAKREIARRVLIAALSVVVACLGVQLYAPFHRLTTERFGTLIKNYDTNGREVSWQTSIKEFAKHPLGSGSGSYEQQSSDYQQSLAASSSAIIKDPTTNQPMYSQVITTKDGDQIILTPSAHNTYLRVLLENGVPGLLLLLLFWIWLAIRGGWAIWRSGFAVRRNYMVIAWVSYIALLPMGMFIDTLHWRFVWLMAGVLAASLLLAEDKDLHAPDQA